MRTLPPLAAVRVFEAAARLENFSRAAEELALTQAGVSYQIKLLEERIGAQLFVRQGRGIMLTDLGRRIAPRVTEAFGMLGEAFSTARAENESILSITAPRTFGTNWLAGRLGAFHIVRPELAVRLDVSDEVFDLPASEFDVAVRTMRGPVPGLERHFLMRVPVTPLATPAFLERYPLETPGDLLKVPRLSPTDDWWDLWFGSLTGEALDHDRHAGLRFESQVLDGQAVIAGHAAAILSPPMFKEAVDAGLLLQPFPHVAMYHSAFWLVYPERKRRLTKVRAFRDWILHEVRQAAGDDPYGILEAPSD